MNRTEWFRELRLGAAGGLSIAIGGAVFLLADNKLAGAFLFSVGLFTICTMGLNLFTGKACGLVRDRSGKYLARLAVIWIGNLIGAEAAGLLLSFTRLSEKLIPAAQAVCAAKLAQSPGSTFILAVFCNILIWLAVTGFREIGDPVGKYLALILGVTVFVACGFEHCVANMFYLAMAQLYTGQALLFLLICTAGNVAGAVLIPLLRGPKQE